MAGLTGFGHRSATFFRGNGDRTWVSLLFVENLFNFVIVYSSFFIMEIITNKTQRVHIYSGDFYMIFIIIRDRFDFFRDIRNRITFF